MLRNVSFTNRFAAVQSDERWTPLQQHPDDKDEDSERKQRPPAESWLYVIACGLLLSALDIALAFGAGYMTFQFLSRVLFDTRQTGFYCHQLPGLSAPLVDHTISVPHLLYTALLLPPLLFDVSEAVYLHYATDMYGRLRTYFATTTHYIVRYLLGFALQSILMEFFKCTVGRLRPNFVAMCDVDWAAVGVNCNAAGNSDVYIEQAHCRHDQWHQDTARQSFPSGHTSCAVYMFVCCALYLTELVGCERLSDAHRTTLGWRQRASQMLLIVLFVWTCVVGVSRVTDGWHHPTDVMAGAGLGIACAYATHRPQPAHARRIRHRL